MFCPTCGTANLENITTCGKCGFNLYFIKQAQEQANFIEFEKKRRKIQARGFIIFFTGFLYFIFMTILSSIAYKLILFLNGGSVTPSLSYVYGLIQTLAFFFPLFFGVGMMTWVYGWITYRI